MFWRRQKKTNSVVPCIDKTSLVAGQYVYQDEYGLCLKITQFNHKKFISKSSFVKLLEHVYGGAHLQETGSQKTLELFSVLKNCTDDAPLQCLLINANSLLTDKMISNAMSFHNKKVSFELSLEAVHLLFPSPEFSLRMQGSVPFLGSLTPSTALSLHLILPKEPFASLRQRVFNTPITAPLCHDLALFNSVSKESLQALFNIAVHQEELAPPPQPQPEEWTP